MPTSQKLFCKSCFKHTQHLPGGQPLGMICNVCDTIYKNPFNEDIHKNLEAIVTIAKHDAKDHNCNYNIIISNPVDGEFGEGSTYEIVADSYFEKERPNSKLLVTTLQLGVLIYDEWLPYTEYEKQECDIKLKDGTIVKHCYPNAGSFSPMCADSIEPIDESQVAEIMYRKYYLEDICKKNNYNCNNIEGNHSLPPVAELEKELSYMADKETMKKLEEIRVYHESAGLPRRKIKGKIVPVRTTSKIHRNDPCSCGSGKKYKKCCGKNS
jgi:hypothetical protein